MCTAIMDDRLFGRTLDLEVELGECVAVMPRDYELELSGGSQRTKYAVIGTALMGKELPLFFDGVNEAGVAAAALNFPHSAKYSECADGALPSHELILLVLGFCGNLGEVRAILSSRSGICGASVSGLSPSPLHWIITDGEKSITVETGEEGLRIYENPLGVLTNEPPFPYQLMRAADYMGLDSLPPKNLLAPEVSLPQYSRGMGAIGLPGDGSSSSRFVRAVYTKEKTEHTLGTERISRFFHIMDTVAQPKGCAVTEEGLGVFTVYTSCIDLETGDYYYTTYSSRRVRAVTLTEALACSESITCFSMHETESIAFATP